MSSDPITPSMGLRARWLATGALALVLVAVFAAPTFGPRAASAVDPSAAPEHTIAVTGMGRVIIAPDVADIQVGVTMSRSTVKVARADAAAAMTKVVAALRAAGIADKDIQTSILSLSPNYDYTANGQGKITGYTLSNAVSATVRDLDRISDALDGAMAAGATNVGGITFRVDDPAAAQAQARTQAMAQAKAKAEQLASAAGVRITGVASIDESSTTPSPINYDMRAAAPSAAGVATPVEVGTNEVDVTVSVSYLIG
jgi:uncharacterized protein YggE